MAATIPLRERRRTPSWIAFAGPGFAVSMGYVDPGNWASDLAAGSYGFGLLWAVLLASAMAILLQVAVTRITIARGNDLASLLAARWPRARVTFWLALQGAVMATDVAEFTGIVLGARLVFKLPLQTSVLLAVAVVWLLLALCRRTVRLLDVATAGALLAIACVYLMLAASLHPHVEQLVRGAVVPSVPDGNALLVVVAIVGATIMPHNLFLHSALVRTRMSSTDPHTKPFWSRFYARETFVALGLASCVNAAILIVGGALGGGGSIAATFAALAPRAGIDTAMLFGLGLLASGIAAAATATYSADAVFAAFSPIRWSPVARRAVTMVPVTALLLLDVDSSVVLIDSQTVLCCILPVALVPVLMLLREDGLSTLRSKLFFAGCGGASALCLGLDAFLVVLTFHQPT